MCGIIARVGVDDAAPRLVSGLENLEYRGYDSSGIAVQNGSGINIQKQAGEVDDLKRALDRSSLDGNVGIGHTRWSTHGPPTDANAHPHTDDDDTVAVVHNGVIENHGTLRSWLADRGHEFTSDTDTEVVPHLLEHHLERADDPLDAFRTTVQELEGSYALTALVDGVDAVYAARQGSPLVLGLGEQQFFLASDVPAFLEHTDEVVYFEDGDVAEVRPEGVTMTAVDGSPVDREVESVDWDPDETAKGAYDHYMRKEIDAQPSALSNTIRGRIGPESERITFDDFDEAVIRGVDEVQFVGCGTSYHAAIYGSRLLNRTGIRSRAIRANEYDSASGPVGDDTLVVAVTQSGETADTMRALESAQAAGARTLTVTNVMGSSAARTADDAVFIRAGPEIGVAATKTFSSQVVTLSLLVHHLAEHATRGTRHPALGPVLAHLEALPTDMMRVLNANHASRIARQYLDHDAYFFIGRGLGHAVAREGALKFKEITYEHAEGFASGELKHGPLAMVTPQTPVIAVFTGQDDEKTLTNAREAQTRGADILTVAEDGHSAVDVGDAHLRIPETHPAWAGLLANVQLQLLAYHAADAMDRSIDKPRNLAKSVTVE
jgi:glucosamine--fructose-6-phosphate aminotransferase (isomerizing)